MYRRYVFTHALFLLLLFFAGTIPCLAADTTALSDDDFVVVSGPASPRVAYALVRTAQLFTVILDVQAAVAPAITGEVGVMAGNVPQRQRVVRQILPAQRSLRQEFQFPVKDLVASPADWSKLRIGIAVAWGGGALGSDRLRERFLHLGNGAVHAGLSENSAEWSPIDLKEYETQVADRKNRISIKFTQPMNGKATFVIEDAQGKRVRNLVAGQEFSKGAHTLLWDGLDEHGNVVSPGAYRWRAIHHPGITPEYLFAYCNDPGPNHTCFNAATTGKGLIFFGAPVTEGGYALMGIDSEGRKQVTFTPIMGTGIEKVALAADGEYLYAAHDGESWGKTVEKTLSLTRFNIASGQSVDFPGGKRFVTLNTRKGKNEDTLDLGGLALLQGKLYLSSRLTNALLVLDPASGNTLEKIKLTDPGPLCADGVTLLAVSGSSVVRITLATKETTTVIPAGKLSPQGLAVDGKGNLYVSDGASNTVEVYTPTGDLQRTLGQPGGEYAGAYNKERMVNPRGLAVAANGWLWVTEDRWTPKRYLAWDTATGKVAAEKFGPTAYGAPGAGFDAADATHWIGQGTLWQVDMAKKSAVPLSILNSHFGATHYRFVHKDGRTFLIGFGGYTSISELLADGSVKDLACIASTHRFSFGMGWNPPAAFIEAFDKAYPGKKFSDKGPGMLWVDKNGDGGMQADEFDFSTASENFAGAYWGNDFSDLTLRVPATVNGKCVLVTLAPQGYYPGGAPKYPPLNEACRAGAAIGLPTNEVETTTDRFGNMLVNSDPEMTTFAPDGTPRWSYPNRWTNVHGSHEAPLPEVGQMQGALFFLGTAPFDANADVFMMNGNHGRFFVLTSDGFYLDEMFKDVRLGGAWDEYMIGGECFGGFFGQSTKDGQYYLQSGNLEYRIFRIHGLQQAVRGQGALTVTPAQVVAAERARVQQAVVKSVPKEAVIPRTATPIGIDGKDDDWQAAPTANWTKGQSVEARLTYDADNLYLYYQVKDSSPWKNNGKDWTLLFKTGDSIDLQLGTDPAANPKRSGPTPGDLRLLIAPFNGENIAVLYRHRLPGATDGVTFTCPWRSEHVDSVKRLTTARIAVKVENGQYRVEAAIPLADLGLTTPAGKTLKADFGALFGDDAGQITLLRSYWSNQFTNLVNDVPGEIMLTPAAWGTVKFD